MRIQHIVLAHLTIAAIALITSCSDNGEVLSRIDSIIEQDPASAINQLSETNRSGFSADDSAYYALLYTQAQIKNYIDTDNDSLIDKAYRHYRFDGTGDRCIRAYFYHGTVSLYAGRRTDALRDFLYALDIAEADNNHGWAARSAEALSDIFLESYNYDQADEYRSLAIKYFDLAGDETRKRYAIIDLARGYLNNDKYYRAASILDSINNVLSHENCTDSALLNYIKAPIISAYTLTNRVTDLDQNILSVFNTDTLPELQTDNAILQCEMHQAVGNFDSADMALEKLHLLARTDDEVFQYAHRKYKNALIQKKYKEAALLADTVLTLQTDISNMLVGESLVGVQRDYFSAKSEMHKNTSERLTLILIIVVTAALIITTLLLIIHKLRMRAKKAELENVVNSLIYSKEQFKIIKSENDILSDKIKRESEVISNLKNELTHRPISNNEHEQIIESLFREKWETLNMLCNEYLEVGESEKTKMAVLHNIEKKLEQLRSPKNIRFIEDSVNKYLNGIVSRLREQCTFLKEEEINLLTYLYAGFTVKTICFFLQIKYKNFYLRKARIIKKIESSNATEKELFITKLR